MQEGFFRRVSIDREARTAQVETLIGTTTWYGEVTRESIDPENFDYAAIVGGAKRVLKNDTGPYQYYWVTTDMAALRKVVKEMLSGVCEIFTRFYLLLRIARNQCTQEQHSQC